MRFRSGSNQLVFGLGLALARFASFALLSHHAEFTKLRSSNLGGSNSQDKEKVNKFHHHGGRESQVLLGAYCPICESHNYERDNGFQSFDKDKI